jgi:hypothetical protein
MTIKQAKIKGINNVNTFVNTLDIESIFNELITNINNFNKYSDLVISYVLESKFKTNNSLINYTKQNNLNPLFSIKALMYLGGYTLLLDYFNATKKDKTILFYNKQNNEFKDKYSFCFNVINEYYDNTLNLNVNAQLIVGTERKYSNNLKEGITIKKEPYNSIYIINIFGFNGGTFDAIDKTLTDTKQKGINIYVNKLPTKKELIQTISLIPLFENNKDNQILFSNDLLTNKVAYNLNKLNELINGL